MQWRAKSGPKVVGKQGVREERVLWVREVTRSLGRE